MTQAVKSSLYSSSMSQTNELAENRDNNNNIYDITNGHMKDAKSVRIKVSDDESQAIAVLQQHYAKQLGREVSLSNLVALLVSKNLQEQFSLDLTQLSNALSAGLTLPDFSLPKFGGKF